MALKGPDGGSGNSTYHCAYYFFEEKRIKEGKPKSAKRKKNETMWGSDGHSTETQRGGWYMM